MAGFARTAASIQRKLSMDDHRGSMDSLYRGATIDSSMSPPANEILSEPGQAPVDVSQSVLLTSSADRGLAHTQSMPAPTQRSPLARCSTLPTTSSRDLTLSGDASSAELSPTRTESAAANTSPRLFAFGGIFGRGRGNSVDGSGSLPTPSQPVNIPGRLAASDMSESLSTAEDRSGTLEEASAMQDVQHTVAHSSSRLSPDDEQVFLRYREWHDCVYSASM